MRKRPIIFFLLLPLLSLAQKPELLVPVGHSDRGVDHIYSPDGRYILTYTFSDPTVRLWNLDGKELQSFQTGVRPLQAQSASRLTHTKIKKYRSIHNNYSNVFLTLTDY